MPASHNVLVASQIHNHHEPKTNSRYPDEGIDSAIESRSLSINTVDDGIREVTIMPKQLFRLINIFYFYFLKNKITRSVHSSSTRRKVNRLFSNGSEPESTSARTLTPDNNESGVYSTDTDTNGAKKDQLFSTKPRLARSGSKSKLDRSQLPPTDTSQHSNDKSHRLTNSYVEVVGRGYADEKPSTKRSSNENFEQTHTTKQRTKVLKSKLIKRLDKEIDLLC